MRPLQVYLDSSDFSVMSDPNRPDWVDGIERSLLSWQSAGLIDLRFSYLHVIEASPIRPEDISSSSARMRKIQQLCGQKCFASTISIIEKEISTPGAWAQCDYGDWILKNNGDWLPNLNGFDIGIASPLEIIRKEIAESSPDRATKRRAERQFFDKDGKLRPAARARFRKTEGDAIQELEHKYPFPSGMAKRILSCMLGDAKSETIESLLKESFGDISLWPSWYENNWEKVSPISSFLRTAGNEIGESLRVATEEIKNAWERGVKEGYSENELERMLKALVAEQISQLFPRTVERLSLEQGLCAKPASTVSAFDARPGLATAIAVQSLVAKRSIGHVTKPRAPSDSDFGDVMHCVHLPFVDFFRADGFTSSVIAEAKLPFSTVVIPKLAQLPAQIESRLTEGEYS